MKISKIKIENFRSLKNVELELGDFNLFVGQNNHGKTNFFEAIDWFYTGKGELGKICFDRNTTNIISVEIEFVDIQDGIEKMKNEKNKTAIRNLLGEYSSVKVKRTSTDPKIRKIYDEKKEGWLEKNPTGFDTAFNDFLPKFEYVNTKTDPLSVAKYGKNSPITSMLSGVLNTILETNTQYAEFKEKFDTLFTSEQSEIRTRLDELSGRVKVYLEKQFDDCTKVTFEVSPPIFDDLLKNFETSIDDGVYTDAEEKGDGMQRALMLAIIQAYSDFRRENDDTSKFFLFFIDEGELHLHPSAQRKLKNALLDLSQKGDQIFINTHSSVLIVDENDKQKVFKVEKNNKETQISLVSKTEKPYVIYELLGGSPSDLLLPKNFMILEGRSDLEFMTKVIERHYPEKPAIQIIPANGDVYQAKKSLEAVEHVFKAVEKSIYKDRVVIAVDNQEQKHIDNFKKTHPDIFTNSQFFMLAENSLEESYPTQWKKSESEVKTMGGPDKVELAKLVGANITKNDFEENMTNFKKALDKCWGLTFE